MFSDVKGESYVRLSEILIKVNARSSVIGANIYSKGILNTYTYLYLLHSFKFVTMQDVKLVCNCYVAP